jgi:thiol-disulfide isomerase/thioredoxin
MRGLFFLLGVLGIVLAINVDLSAKPAVFPVVSVFSYAEVEGLMAAVVSANSETAPPEPTECNCNGTKKIKSGDGLIEIKCPCGDECKCKQNSGSQPSIEAAAVELPSPLTKGNPFSKIDFLKKKRILVYVGAEWCPPCHWVKDNAFPLLEEKEWEWNGQKFHYTVGPSVDDMIIVVDYDGESMNQLCEFLEIQKPDMSLPTFWKIDVETKKIVKEMVGGHNAESIHRMFITK